MKFDLDTNNYHIIVYCILAVLYFFLDIDHFQSIVSYVIEIRRRILLSNLTILTSQTIWLIFIFEMISVN